MNCLLYITEQAPQNIRKNLTLLSTSERQSHRRQQQINAQPMARQE